MIFAAATQRPKQGCRRPSCAPLRLVLFPQWRGRGISPDGDAHPGYGGATIRLPLPREPLLIGAKVGHPVLYFGSDFAGDSWPRRLDVEWGAGRRFDELDRVDRRGLNARLFVRLCAWFPCVWLIGVALLVVSCPVGDRLNERQRLRDQEVALSYPFHDTPRPETL